MLTYKKAGVDIDLADRLVEYIARRTPGIGGFAGLFPIEPGSRDPLCLVASTDGVGTKLKVAFALNRHDTVGIDLVAMSANDLICAGAKPLFFLDYYAMGKLELERSKRLVDGIIEGCRQAEMALLGGETAEMPGFYPKGEYDLAGFAVGAVRKSQAIDGSKVIAGDVLLGLPSSGLHSNGFSLVRRVFPGRHLKRRGPELLTPTRIYVKDFRRLSEGLAKKGQAVLALAHITGGGLPENLPRVLPKGLRAVVTKGAWAVPDIFAEVQRLGRVPEAEMWRTFNMGLGLVAAVRPESVDLALKLLPDARVVGRVEAGRPGVRFE
ncbi:MAG: phosphoribosylformylglycinamidine cyclo-ligase [Elusimicrobia bacterium]|nr:phosphoribosylformylglycinamidine cyclo-ligase [Elusimicrobiota bacterium]